MTTTDLPAAPEGMVWLVDTTLCVRTSTGESVYRLGIYPKGCHVERGFVRGPKKGTWFAFGPSETGTMREMENPKKLHRMAESVLRQHRESQRQRQEEEAFLASINSRAKV